MPFHSVETFRCRRLPANQRVAAVTSHTTNHYIRPTLRAVEAVDGPSSVVHLLDVSKHLTPTRTLEQVKLDENG